MSGWSWVGEWDKSFPWYGKPVSRAFVHSDGKAGVVTVTQDVEVMYDEKWYVSVDGSKPRLLNKCQSWDEALCLAVGHVEWSAHFRLRSL